MKEFLFRNDGHDVNDNQPIKMLYHGGFIPLSRKDLFTTLNKKFGVSQTEDPEKMKVYKSRMKDID